MARESDDQSRRLTRRTTHYRLGDGRTAYYPSGGGVSVVLPPSVLGRWYERVNDWAETLIDVLEKLDDVLNPPKPPPTGPSVPDGLGTANQVSQVLYLLRKVGHVLLLAACAPGYFVYVRTKHLLGLH